MSAKVIICCLLLILLLMFFIFRGRKSPRVAGAAEEQALIIKISLSSGTADGDEQTKWLHALEDRLNTAIKESGVGEYDGNQIGEGVCTIFIYGPSAERLVSMALPILKEFRPPVGSYVIKRHGKPGSKEDRVALNDASS
jgi:hypothetical protein